MNHKYRGNLTPDEAARLFGKGVDVANTYGPEHLWVYGYLSNKDTIRDPSYSEPNEFRVTPGTVGAYVDRNDRYGKEIYEHDIVQVITDRGTYEAIVIIGAINARGNTAYVHTAPGTLPGNLRRLDDIMTADIIVIGNEHDGIDPQYAKKADCGTASASENDKKRRTIPLTAGALEIYVTVANIAGHMEKAGVIAFQNDNELARVCIDLIDNYDGWLNNEWSGWLDGTWYDTNSPSGQTLDDFASNWLREMSWTKNRRQQRTW